jgi:hypothetical protein
MKDNILAQWPLDAVSYQLHVKAYRDSDRDGFGHFKGLIQKLDYIASLGVTAAWLLPFYPSPLHDDGYDIADCTNPRARCASGSAPSSSFAAATTPSDADRSNHSSPKTGECSLSCAATRTK